MQDAVTFSTYLPSFCRRNACDQEPLAILSLSNFSFTFPQPRRTYRAALCTELMKPLVVRDVPSSPLQSHEVKRVAIHPNCLM